MSFFKQFLPDYLESSIRPPTPPQDQTAGQPISTDNNSLPITLDLVREALLDPDGYDPYEPGDDDSIPCESGSPSSDLAQAAATVDQILQATRSYLDAEIAKEQHGLDWTSEYKFEKIVLHPKGNELPQFSSAEELKHVVNPNDLLIPVKTMGMKSDKAAMDRIRAGLGPRPVQTEELIEKLRLEPRHYADFGQPQTYDELLQVLQAWNAQVRASPDQTQAREEALYALKARCHLIDAVETGKEDMGRLQEHCVLLRDALHAFRPELKDFDNEDLTDQLIIMVANEGVANPGLGDEVRHLAIQTLFHDRRLKISSSDEHKARRNRLDAELQRARIQEDGAEEAHLLDELQKLEKKVCDEASMAVRTAIKLARGQLYKLTLEDLETLAEQQAGQKEAAAWSVRTTPATLLAQRCIDSGTHIDHVIRDWNVSIEDNVTAVGHSMQRMNRLDTDNRRQSKKLAGLDVSKADRKSVMERRRKDYRTPLIMKEVEDQRLQVRDLSRSVLKRMETIGSRLDEALEIASSSYRAHDALLARLDDGGLECMEAAQYVIMKGGVGEDAHAGVAGATEDCGKG